MIITNRINFVGFNTSNNEFINIYQRQDSLLTKTFDIVSILKNHNDKGFNIYNILNDFDTSRSESELIGFNYIGIDLDYYTGTEDDILESCTNLLGFLPSKINKTFKGYHVYFSLHSSLYYLDIDIYKQFYNLVNTSLNGDLNMRSVTGILKTEGYLDKKDSREFLITTVYSSDDEVTQVEIEKLNIQVVLDEERKNKFLTKQEKKERNSKMFGNIDALDFIRVLNESNLFNYITVENNTIDGNSGLKIYTKNDGFTEIKDFSGKGRYGIKNFLFNYVLKINPEIDFVKVTQLLNKNFGIKLNKGLLEKPIYNTYLQYNIEKNKLSIDTTTVALDMVEKYNLSLQTIQTKGELTKVLLGILNLCYSKDLDMSKEFYIQEKELINILNLSSSANSKAFVRETLLLLSNLNAVVDRVVEKDGKTRVGQEFKRLFNYTIFNSKGRNGVEFLLKFNVKPTKSLWINPTILEIKSPVKTYVATKISSSISEFGTCNYNIEELTKDLDCNVDNAILFLKDLKSKKIIKDYKKTDSTIYISK